MPPHTTMSYSSCPTSCRLRRLMTSGPALGFTRLFIACIMWWNPSEQHLTACSWVLLASSICTPPYSPSRKLR